jgi:hypothetical protein
MIVELALAEFRMNVRSVGFRVLFWKGCCWCWRRC